MLQRARQPDAQHVREKLQLLQLFRLVPADYPGGHNNPQQATHRSGAYGP